MTDQELEVRVLSDEDLDKELAFAELAADPMPAAVRWLELLRAEKAHRT